MTGIGKTVSKNVVILFIRQLITWASTFLLLLFLPGHLGPINYGKYYLGQSVVSMFSLLIDFGGHYSIPKAVSRNRERAGQIISDSFGIRALLWLVSFAGVNLYAFLVDYDSVTRMIIFIFSIGMTWSGARSVLWACYQGFELMKYPSYATTVESVFISIIGVVALVLGIGPVGFTIITVIGTFLNFLVCIKFLPNLTKFIPHVKWKESISLLKEGIPYFLNSVFSVIYYRIDTVMLSLMVPSVVLGWYGASYRFFDSLMFLPSIFTIAIFPALARMWGENRDPIGRSVQKSLDFMLLLGIPISICVFVFSGEIIDFFYGLKGYKESILLLKIFSIGMLLVYLDNMLGTAILASDKQKQLSIIAFLAVIVNIGLNYFCIPYTHAHFGNGGIGSAVATVITEYFIMISMVGILSKTVLQHCKINVQVKSLLGGIIMIISLFAMHVTMLIWVAQALIATAIYFAALYLLKAFEDSDISMLKGLLPRRLLGNMEEPDRNPR